MWEYRVVPFLGTVEAGQLQAAQVVATQLQSLIMQHAAQGWEYMRLERIELAVKPGCLAALLGAKETYTTLQVAVFRLPAG